jgi:precorrin-6Y C5,15-methyltransferase (decarboxylating)
VAEIFVIGIGYRPLGKREKEIVLCAQSILASQRLFDIFIRYEEFGMVRDRIKVISNVDETFTFVRSLLSTPPLEDSTSRNIVLLASGDPLFFGIGKRAIEEFGKERVEILPDLSSVQVAFARIKESWDGALLISLHGGPDPEKRRRLEYGLDDIPSLVAHSAKLAILTDRENTPKKIAGELLRSGVAGHDKAAITMYVCEKLGYPDEKITRGTPEGISRMDFNDPNVVIIIAGQ